MAAYKLTFLLVFLSYCFILPCEASPCSSEKDCLHFEYCCKGNCTWKRLQCEHICQTDHECQSESRCVLGMCENCTTDFSCTRKSCLNDSHCPGGHSCEKKLCEVKKQSNITAEMAPFLIFITALSVSLLIVCYNDYFIERHQSWRERIERVSCNCSVALWFWMWRYRRSQQQSNENSTCRGIEVQFDARSSYPSNSLNEKPTRQTFRPLRSINRILFFWQRNNEESVCETSHLEENNREELTANVQASNPVVLLDQFMNNNRLVTCTPLSSLDHQSSSSSEQQNEHRSANDQNSSEPSVSLNHFPNDLKSSRLETQTGINRLNDQQHEVNNCVDTCSREVTSV